VKHEPTQWAAITAQVGSWGTPHDAAETSALYCAEAREREEPVPAHWEDADWWAAAEEALTDEIKARGGY
jgi:hypothetical protein